MNLIDYRSSDASDWMVMFGINKSTCNHIKYVMGVNWVRVRVSVMVRVKVRLFNITVKTMKIFKDFQRFADFCRIDSWNGKLKERERK